MDWIKLMVALAIGCGGADSGRRRRRLQLACEVRLQSPISTGSARPTKLESPQLRACMRSAGANISRRCLDTLADAGEIPRKYHSSFADKGR